MKPGDKVKIFKGMYKGMKGILRSRMTETDTKTKHREPCWTVWIGDKVEMVYESEIKNG